MGCPLPAELTGDYHVHSTFSDDAVSTLAENIEAASDRGLTEIRLVEHVRASTSWVPEFLAAVGTEAVPPGLNVRTGVEAKLLDATGALDLPSGLPLGATGVDVVLIADHQFPGPDGPWSPRETRERLGSGLARADVIDLLIGATIAAMHLGLPGQLAHPFSILPKVGLSDDDLTDEHLDAWGQAAAATGTLIEMNEKWDCPGPRALRAAVRAGASLVASTDSHDAADVGRYDRVTAMLAGL